MNQRAQYLHQRSFSFVDTHTHTPKLNWLLCLDH